MTSFVTVSPINHVFNKVLANSEGIHKDLYEYFTFKVPGAHFSPKYKSKLWDGKIRLYHLQKHTLYAGLNHELESFCAQRDIEVIYDNEPLARNFSAHEALAYVKTLDLPFAIRDFQLAYFVHAIRLSRALIISPTASGKSLIAYLITRYLTEQLGFKKGLLIVPRINLVTQMVLDFGEYGYDIQNNIHPVFEGANPLTDKPITISTWQSLFRHPASAFKDYNFVINDEVHEAKAVSLKTILENCVNASVRIGMTGSLDESKTNERTLEGLFGRKYQIVKTHQLIERGDLAGFKIKGLVLKHPEAVCKIVADSNPDFQKEMDFLIGHKKRTAFIANLALSLKGNTMVFYQFVEKHGEKLFEAIEAIAGDRPVYYIHGGIKADEREAIRQQLEIDTNAIVVTSFGTNSTGSNFKNLHNVIFASSYKTRVKTLQTIGRGLRKGSNKDECILFDIADDLRYGKHMNHSLRHFQARMQLYGEERFNFKLYKINL